MLLANSDQIGHALALLTEGLVPYVEAHLRAAHGQQWHEAIASRYRGVRTLSEQRRAIDWDAHLLLTVMWDQWNTCFRHDLGHAERSLVSELREYRNRWAHQQSFDFDDTYRILDSVRRLLSAANAPNLEAIERQKSELLEAHLAEAVNAQVQNTAFHRNRWWMMLIYAMCCGLIITHMVMSSRSGTSVVISIVVLVFTYLAYQLFKADPGSCSKASELLSVLKYTGT